MIVVNKQTVYLELKEISEISKESLDLIWKAFSDIMIKHLIAGEQVDAFCNGHCVVQTVYSKRERVNLGGTRLLWNSDPVAAATKTKIYHPPGSRIDVLNWYKSKRPWALKRLYSIFPCNRIKNLIREAKKTTTWLS